MSSLKDVLSSEKHEEWVQYFIFPKSPQEGGSLEGEELLFQLNAAAQTIIGDYIWHNQPFALRRSALPLSSFDEEGEEEEDKTKNYNSSSPPLFFHGITRFGDNLEDEWFIVHVLKELSIKFPGIIAKVEDNDGEFLLIEAADHLPDWAESDESCKNRVFIHQGMFHLIPPQMWGTETPLRLEKAVEIMKKRSKDTLASQEIQDSTEKRIGKYPQKMDENFQHVSVMLPPLLAYILREKPNLVSVGSLAFYLRDPISLKTARLMKTFQPGKGLIKGRVRFTKCLYAMLMKQDFRPDPRSSWPFPANALAPDYKAHGLGVKLTTGFEILLSQTSSASTGEHQLGFLSDSGWFRYEDALKKMGYFRGLLEGSKPFEVLLKGAQEFYKANLQVNCSSGDDYSWEKSVCEEVRHLVDNATLDVNELKEESQNLLVDDDDSWLSIRPEDLEFLLEAKFQSGGLNPDDIPSKLKEFMKQISDFSGVEQGAPPTNNSGSPSSTGTGSPHHGNGTQLDGFGETFDFKADDFKTAVEKLLHDLGAPDKEWEASDDSYGSDEEDFNVDLESIKKMQTLSKESQEFVGIMNQMDDELCSTKVGQTFSSSTPTASSSSSNKKKPATASLEELDEYDEKEGLTPVDIDMSALADMLKSFQSQAGPSGPSSNLLKSVGFDMTRMQKK